MNSEQTRSTQYLNFSDALHHLRWGERVARRTWSPGYYIKVAYHRSSTRIMHHSPYAAPEGWRVPSTQLMAEDWYVLGEQQ